MSRQIGMRRSVHIGFDVDEYFDQMLDIFATKRKLSRASAVRLLLFQALTASDELEPEQARLDAIQWSKR